MVWVVMRWRGVGRGRGRRGVRTGSCLRPLLLAAPPTSCLAIVRRGCSRGHRGRLGLLGGCARGNDYNRRGRGRGRRGRRRRGGRWRGWRRRCERRGWRGRRRRGGGDCSSLDHSSHDGRGGGRCSACDWLRLDSSGDDRGRDLGWDRLDRRRHRGGYCGGDGDGHRDRHSISRCRNRNWHRDWDSISRRGHQHGCSFHRAGCSSDRSDGKCHCVRRAVGRGRYLNHLGVSDWCRRQRLGGSGFSSAVLLSPTLPPLWRDGRARQEHDHEQRRPHGRATAATASRRGVDVAAHIFVDAAGRHVSGTMHACVHTQGEVAICLDEARKVHTNLPCSRCPD